MNLIKFGTVLIIIGFAAVFIVTELFAQKTNIGGLIMIGPIPIAFGTSTEFTIIAMILGILLMILFFVIGRRNEMMERNGIPVQDITEGSKTKVKGGGVIFIGPIPIIFGSDPTFRTLSIFRNLFLPIAIISEPQ